jgi:integrase
MRSICNWHADVRCAGLGELLGLCWADVNLTTGRIAIRHTLVMVDGKPAVAEPKTAKGRRSLILAPDVLDTLRAHRARQAAERLALGAGYSDLGLVITTEDGRPMHPETLSGRSCSAWVGVVV